MEVFMVYTKEKKEFLSPFTVAYWKSAAREVTNIRTLSVCAVLMALRLVMKMYLVIPVGDSLNVTLGYLVNAISGSICGPVLAFISGAICDIIGCIVAPKGPYFPIFTLIEAFCSFCFAICLYRVKITAPKLALSKGLVNLFGNIIFNSTALGIVYGKGFWYYMAKSIVKNVLMYPIEIILLILIFNAVTPILERMKLIPSPQTKMDVDIKRYIIVAVAVVVVVALSAVYYAPLKEYFTQIITSI